MTKRDATASDHLPTQAAAMPQDERAAGLSGQPESIHTQALLAQVLDRANLQRALKQVRQNKGAPGIDGMTVDELPDYLRRHWREIRAKLETGSYQPQPVKRVDIPKPDGKTRPLGIPTVLDRFIQQAMPKALRGAGSRASCIKAMGTLFSSAQLRLPAVTLGASSDTRSAILHSARLWLGGGHGPASVL